MNNDEIEWACEQAAYDIATYLHLFKVPVRSYKEKYRTVRVYTGLGWNRLSDITHPGHIYNRLPQWLFHLDLYYGDKVMYYSGLSWLSYKVHCIVYRKAYKKVIDKYPEIKDNILRCADYPELLKEL